MAITPTSRTTLYALKPAFVRRLSRAEKALSDHGVTADQLTVAAVGIALATAAALVVGTRLPGLWLLVAPLCLARMACNAMDGAMARRTGSATKRGAVLNELGDRAADVVTFAALGPVIGWPAALVVVLTAVAVAFVAVTAQAVTGHRLGQGPMGKPDRVAVLAAGATVAAFAGPSPLRVAAGVIVLGGLVTVLRRTVALWRLAGAAS